MLSYRNCIVYCSAVLSLTAMFITLSPALLRAAEPSVFDGHNRAAEADALWNRLHGNAVLPESADDPELAAIMKKYVYGDIAAQCILKPSDRALVTLAVLTVNQNRKLLSRAADEALTLGCTPVQMRETLYQLAPYVGFAKVFEALEPVNDVFRRRGIKLPLENQGTVTDTDRFEKGLALQVKTYGEVIGKMRAAAPQEQKHLQDDLSAFCFGDIYTRRSLDMKTREMITMAAIGAMGGADAQFSAHVDGYLAAGASPAEAAAVITAMNPWIGFPRTLNCLALAGKVIQSRSGQ
jgi:4-carboxymuconolactone decarboxylase